MYAHVSSNENTASIGQDIHHVTVKNVMRNLADISLDNRLPVPYVWAKPGEPQSCLGDADKGPHQADMV
jgi:hypothetical protein